MGIISLRINVILPGFVRRFDEADIIACGQGRQIFHRKHGLKKMIAGQGRENCPAGRLDGSHQIRSHGGVDVHLDSAVRFGRQRGPKCRRRRVNQTGRLEPGMED